MLRDFCPIYGKIIRFSTKIFEVDQGSSGSLLKHINHFIAAVLFFQSCLFLARIKFKIASKLVAKINITSPMEEEFTIIISR